LVALLNLIVLQIEISVCIYTNNPSVIIFLTGSCWTLSVRKIFVGNFWFVGESAVNKFTDGLQMENTHQKKITRFILLVILSVQFSISPTGEPYVITSVNLHITDKMSSVILSVS
jgi:hypothetical protein